MPTANVAAAGARMLDADASEEAVRRSVCELRRVSGLSWNELAQLLGVRRSTALSWASGRPLSAPEQVRLRRVLTLRDLTARDYVESDPLDIDRLSTRGE